MSIRIRKIDGELVALCAARTSPEADDLYLDDNAHHALSAKFLRDAYEEGLLDAPSGDRNLYDLMVREEARL